MGKSLKGLAKHTFPAGSPKGGPKRAQAGGSALHLSFQLHLFYVLPPADRTTGSFPSHEREPFPKKETRGGEMFLHGEVTGWGFAFCGFEVLHFEVSHFKVCVLRHLSFKFLEF
jgi:hypothetical protein